MFKTLRYGVLVFKMLWEANGIYALVIIFSKIYESTIYPLIQIVLLAQVLDLLQQNKVKTVQDLFSLAVIFTFASLLKIGLTTFLDVKQVYYETRMDGWIDLSICKKLTELDPATFEDSEFQNLLAQMDGIKGSLQAQLIRFISLLDVTVKLITATLIIWNVFPWFTLILLLSAIPLYTFWDKFRIKTWPFYVEKRSLVTRVTQYVRNLLSSGSTSKESSIYAIGPTLLSKVEVQQKSYFGAFNKVLTFGYGTITLSRIFHFAIFLVTQVFSLNAVIKGVLTIGQFALYFQQTLTLASSSEELLNQYSSISVRNKYLEKYFEFLKTTPKITSPKNPVQIPSDSTPSEIEFRNVTFRYPGTNRDILKEFNLVIKSGEKIALVGENGAGKSTLIKLLLRFYDVTQGDVLLNGVNIREIDLATWHQRIGVLFQDFIQYQFTFKENVYYGDLNKSGNLELLKKALGKSGADNYLKDLPKQYDQVVGKMFEDGVDLSGGQWQKLALARAFFRDAPILILDEPTSAIDAKAEYEIFERVQKLQQDKTVIIISHRFSTVRNADRILVLDEGRIVEEGDHSALMKKDGLYAELFNIQAKGYK